MNIDVPTNVKVISIQNYGSSGTFFLHSLLDGHPNVIQLPGLLGLNIFSFLNSIDNQAFGDRNVTILQLSEILIGRFYAGLFDPKRTSKHGLDRLGTDRNENACVDRDIFLRNFREILKICLKRNGLQVQIIKEKKFDYIRIFFISLYFAYSHTREDDVSLKNTIVYPFHSGPLIESHYIQKIFRKNIIIHMVRHPIENFDSVAKYYFRDQKYNNIKLNPFFCGISQIFLDHAPHIGREERMNSIYPFDVIENGGDLTEFSLALEQLHAQPEKTLRMMCELSGLSWHENLLKSTFAGKQWWNRPNLKEISGFSSAITERKKLKYLSRFDIWRLNAVAHPMLEQLGYHNVESNLFSIFGRTFAYLSCLAPFRMELNFHDAMRAIVLSCEAKAEGGSRRHKQLQTIANIYWDAQRRTSGFQSAILVENNEITHQDRRLFLLLVDKNGEISSQQINGLDEKYLFDTGVLWDESVRGIPRISGIFRAISCIKIFIWDYLRNRRKLFEAYREISRRKAEIIRPVNPRHKKL